MRKQTGIKRYLWGLLCLATSLFFVACANREISKTVILEDKNAQSDEKEYAVKNIKEYSYEATRKDENWIAWERDTENIYVLTNIKEGYELQKIDIGRGKILSKHPIAIEESTIKNAKIAPGGKCIAYEKEFALGVELYLYDIESNMNVYIGDASEIVYEWSGDGKKIFYSFITKDGKNVAKTWTLRCWSASNELTSEAILRAEGDEGYRKTIFPNKDGSQVYIFNEERDKNEDVVGWLFLLEDGINQQKTLDFGKKLNLPNAVTDIEAQKTIKLPKEITRPIKYTKEGLFAQGNDGTLYLVTNLINKPKTKSITKMDSEQIFICEKGDHIFELKQEDNTEQFEIRSMYLKKGEIVTNRLLYKDVYRTWADAIVSMDDSAIMLKSCEHISEKKYSFKITLLEYGDT